MKSIIKTFIILFVFGIAISLNSCKKCVTCEYYEKSDSHTLEYSTDEVCGSLAKEIEDGCIEDEANAIAEGYEAKCTCN